jgi:cytochrome c
MIQVVTQGCSLKFTFRIGDQMKSVIVGMIAAAGLMVAGSTFAADGAALLKSSNCMGCHKMEGKLVGPGLMDVAKKYKGDAGAAAKLETKVAKGGAGVWGTMPMPAMANVKPEDIKTMVAHILAMAK